MILKNLKIQNFRLLEDLELQKLGRINLLVGKNNVGKSTVLEALRIYSKIGSPILLKELLASHDEVAGEKDPLLVENFFTDNSLPQEDETQIYIGNIEKDDSLTMKYTYFIMEESSETDQENRPLQRRKKEIKYQDISNHDGVRQSLKIEAHNSRLNQPTVRSQLNPPGVFSMWVDFRSFDEADYDVSDLWLDKNQVTVPCSCIPTGLIPAGQLGDIWDEVAPTSYRKYVLEALKLIDNQVEDLTFKKTTLKKFETSKERVPFVVYMGKNKLAALKRAGDGMSRMLQLVLLMIQAQGGCLLIDEFENGLHYAVQTKVWQLLMELANELKVQVFATTHSWDCVKSFQQAAAKSKEEDIMLFRLGRSVLISDRGKVIAIEHDKETLQTVVAEGELEVRG